MTIKQTFENLWILFEKRTHVEEWCTHTHIHTHTLYTGNVYACVTHTYPVHNECVYTHTYIHTHTLHTVYV